MGTCTSNIKDGDSHDKSSIADHNNNNNNSNAICPPLNIRTIEVANKKSSPITPSAISEQLYDETQRKDNVNIAIETKLQSAHSHHGSSSSSSSVLFSTHHTLSAYTANSGSASNLQSSVNGLPVHYSSTLPSRTLPSPTPQDQMNNSNSMNSNSININNNNNNNSHHRHDSDTDSPNTGDAVVVPIDHLPDSSSIIKTNYTTYHHHQQQQPRVKINVNAAFKRESSDNHNNNNDNNKTARDIDAGVIRIIEADDEDVSLSSSRDDNNNNSKSIVIPVRSRVTRNHEGVNEVIVENNNNDKTPLFPADHVPGQQIIPSATCNNNNNNPIQPPVRSNTVIVVPTVGSARIQDHHQHQQQQQTSSRPPSRAYTFNHTTTNTTTTTTTTSIPGTPTDDKDDDLSYMYDESNPDFLAYKQQWEMKNKEFRQPLPKGYSRSLYSPSLDQKLTLTDVINFTTPASPVPGETLNGTQFICNRSIFHALIEFSTPDTLSQSPIFDYSVRTSRQSTPKPVLTPPTHYRFNSPIPFDAKVEFDWQNLGEKLQQLQKEDKIVTTTTTNNNNNNNSNNMNGGSRALSRQSSMGHPNDSPVTVYPLRPLKVHDHDEVIHVSMSPSEYHCHNNNKEESPNNKEESPSNYVNFAISPYNNNEGKSNNNTKVLIPTRSRTTITPSNHHHGSNTLQHEQLPSSSQTHIQHHSRSQSQQSHHFDFDASHKNNGNSSNNNNNNNNSNNTTYDIVHRRTASAMDSLPSQSTTTRINPLRITRTARFEVIDWEEKEVI